MAILKIRDSDGNIREILALKGDKGDSYVLTEADKQEIAAMVSAGAVALTDLSSVPTKVSAFENDAGYVTEKQVQKMIEDAIAKLQGEVVMINFSIEDFKFQAEEGMTWREWVNSEYNTDGACVYNGTADTISFVEYSLDVLSPSNAPVKGSDSIIAGYFYYLS